MTLCPIAKIAHCKNCPIVKVCLMRGTIGDYKKKVETKEDAATG